MRLLGDHMLVAYKLRVSLVMSLDRCVTLFFSYAASLLEMESEMKPQTIKL
jgi:hypothetical protein